jgi:hypothetical protein
MKITVADFNGEDVRVSLQAENEAETFQLADVMRQLNVCGANWSSYGDWDARGVTLVVQQDPTLDK